MYINFPADSERQHETCSLSEFQLLASADHWLSSLSNNGFSETQYNLDFHGAKLIAEGLLDSSSGSSIVPYPRHDNLIVQDATSLGVEGYWRTKL